MALLPGALDYTDKDFDALRVRLIALLRSVFPKWTDYNVLTFGNLLLEMFAFVGGVVTFYQDNQANEAHWPTATQRFSIIKLAKMLGYKLPGASAATVDVKISLTSGIPAGSVQFPKGTICRTQEITDAKKFQILATGIEIPAAADPPEVITSVEDSELVFQSFASRGTPDQEFKLDYLPYLDDSAIMITTQGTWEKVDSFLDSEPLDLHYTIDVDQYDKALIRTGDGILGAIPEGTVNVEYKIGGGSAGNVEPGSIKVVEGSYTDSFGNSVSVICNNEIKASGGALRESIETARIKAPASIRAPRTTVAREDYELHALHVSGVARALMLTSDQDPLITENTGFLYLVPDGGGEPSQALKDAVYDMVTNMYPNTITFKLYVAGTTYLVINVKATVFLKQGVTPFTVKSRIESNLETFMSLYINEDTEQEAPNPNVDFGFNYKDVDGNPAGEIAFSDLYNVVHDTEGVRKIGDAEEDFLLNDLSQDVPIKVREFPTLGTVTLVNGDTGLPL